MVKRITIMIDDDNDKRLRLLQAKRITNSNGSVSFSRVVNDTLRLNLKKK